MKPEALIQADELFKLLMDDKPDQLNYYPWKCPKCLLYVHTVTPGMCHVCYEEEKYK